VERKRRWTRRTSHMHANTQSSTHKTKLTHTQMRTGKEEDEEGKEE
jgi:hypothetical protein